MPYSGAILSMAQNLSIAALKNPNIHENRYCMLSTEHYGLAPQTSITGNGTKPEFLVVHIDKSRHRGEAEEDIVLVAEIKKPAMYTAAGK